MKNQDLRIEPFFDERTYTMTYVVYDDKTRDAVVIDPVLDYDPLASRVFQESVQEVVRFVDDNRLKLRWVLETHAHADHLSGAQYLKKRYGVGIVIGDKITLVQEAFKDIFNLPASFKTDGSQFDRLLADGEVLEAGSLRVKAIHTPGHTPADNSYLVDDAVFTGDALFMPDYGVGRCDFPKGDAEALYRSVHDKLYRLPDETRVFVGHDYLPGGREVRWESTIGEEKRANVQLREDTAREEFVERRTERDKTLSQPRLLFQSVQVNIDAGSLPPPEANGARYFKIPVRTD